MKQAVIHKTNVQIARSGTDKRGDFISDEVLKEAVEKVHNHLELVEDFNMMQMLGYAKNLQYKGGRVFADITIFNHDEAFLEGKVVRCGYLVLSSSKRESGVSLDKVEIVECSLISEINDVE